MVNSIESKFETHTLIIAYVGKHGANTILCIFMSD